MSPTLADIASLAPPIGLGVIGLLVSMALRRTVFARLSRRASASRSEVDDLIVAALQGPVVLAGLILGLYVGLDLWPLASGLERVVQRTLLVLVLVLATWVAARLGAEIVHAQTRPAHGSLPSVTLLPNLTRMTVLVVGALVILESLGISITPIVTALGVGGLAVALALQDTLANLFAGVHVLLSRQVRPGDFVRLSSGEEGYVQDITWRYTTIRQLPNNITVVPNSKLAGAVTTNYYLPEQETAVLVEVGVAYDSDLPAVERVTVDIARSVMREVEGAVPSFEPFIRYHTFGDFSINFTVILRAREVTAQYLIKHEFIKRLHRRYQEEKIEIPFPVRTVELRGDAAERVAPTVSGRRAAEAGKE